MPPLVYSSTDVRRLAQLLQLADADPSTFINNAMNLVYQPLFNQLSQANGGPTPLPGLPARAAAAAMFNHRYHRANLTARGAAPKIMRDFAVQARIYGHLVPRWVIFYRLDHYWGSVARPLEVVRHTLNLHELNIILSIGTPTPADLQLSSIMSVGVPDIDSGKPYLRLECSSPNPVQDEAVSQATALLSGLMLLWTGIPLVYRSAVCYPISPYRTVVGWDRQSTLPPKEIPRPDGVLPGTWPRRFGPFLTRWFRLMDRAEGTLAHRLNVALLFLMRADESPDVAGFVINVCTAVESLVGKGKLAGFRFGYLVGRTSGLGWEMQTAWDALYILRGNVVHGHIGLFDPFPDMPRVPGGGNGRRDWLRAVRVAIASAILLQSRHSHLPLSTIIDQAMLR